MDKRKPSELVLAKKILILRQKYKQRKKEEIILMKRNKKLVDEFQSLKEMSKSLNDERLALQKDLYDKKYAKAVSEGNNMALKNSLSSFLNDLHALQTKVINSWRANQRERNSHSSKKHTESIRQESMEEPTVSEEHVRESQASSPLQDVSSSQDSELVCKVEPLSVQEVNPFLTNHYDLSENKEELSVLLGSFCRRDTVPLDKPPGRGDQEAECLPLERICEPNYQQPENVPHEEICKPDILESENMPLEETCVPDFQESENMPLEETCKPDFQETENLLLEKNCKPGFQHSGNTSFDKTCEAGNQDSENVSLKKTSEPPFIQSANEAERSSPIERPFHAFVEDPNEKAKFTELIERLSLNCETLEFLRNCDIAQSLSVFESNPEITEKEAAITSSLEVELSKHYKIQQLEVSIPRLDLSAYSLPSLNSTIEIPKKEASRRRKSAKSSQCEDRNQRDTTPDSTSESSNTGRLLRRARNVVSYKEKPLTTKLRRS